MTSLCKPCLITSLSILLWRVRSQKLVNPTHCKGYFWHLSQPVQFLSVESEQISTM